MSLKPWRLSFYRPSKAFWCFIVVVCFFLSKFPFISDVVVLSFLSFSYCRLVFFLLSFYLTLLIVVLPFCSSCFVLLALLSFCLTVFTSLCLTLVIVLSSYFGPDFVLSLWSYSFHSSFFSRSFRPSGSFTLPLTSQRFCLLIVLF